MLTAFLREHPMRELLKGGTRRLYPPAEDRKAWDGIPAGYRQEIREMADKMLDICKQECPAAFEGAGPGCVRHQCPEFRPCGHERTHDWDGESYDNG